MQVCIHTGQVEQGEMKWSVSLSAQGDCPLYPQGLLQEIYSSLLWPLELQNKAFLGLQDKQAQKQACNYFMPVLYECSLWLLEILFPSAVRPWQILGGWETRMER